MADDLLSSELGGRPPAGLGDLSREEADRLGEAIREARRAQRRALAAAQEGSLRYIPRLLRAPVRKVLGG